MKTASASIYVDAPPQRVWDLYLDVQGQPRWVPFVEEVVYMSGPVEVGMVYRERTKLGPMRSVDEWRVVEVDAPRRRVDLSTSNAIESRLVLTFTPEGSGTRLRQETEFRSGLPFLLGWLHERFFALLAGRAMSQVVARAKRALESPNA